MPRETTLPGQGRQTRLEGVDTLQRAALSSAQRRAEVSSVLTQMADRLSPGKRFDQADKAVKSIPELTDEARKTRQKAQAQQIVIDTKLLLDEQLQELQRDPNIEPLDLADAAQRFIDQASNRAVGEASQLGEELRDFVRLKMGSYAVDKVPQIRKEGFQRETEESLAGLQHRNFMRQSEMNKAGTSPSRRNELVQEIIDDVGSMVGVHLAADDAQNIIEGYAKDAIKQTWFEMFLTDPQEAIGALETLPIEPQERASMRSTALAAIRAENAANDRDRRMEVWEAQQRSKALANKITNKIVAENFNPATLAETGEAAVFQNGELEGLVRFHRMWTSEVGQSVEDDQNWHAEKSAWEAQAYTGLYSPNEMRQMMMREHDAGNTLMRPEDFSSVMGIAARAHNRLEGVNRSELKQQLSRNESLIEEFFNPLGHDIFDVWATKGEGAQARFTRALATTDFHERVTQEIKAAKQADQNPLDIVNIPAIAFDVLADAVPAVSQLYAGQFQELENEALKDMIIGPGATKLELNRFEETLVEQERKGKLTRKMKEISMSYLGFLRRVKQLPSRKEGQKGPSFQPPEIDAPEESALRRELGLEENQESQPLNQPGTTLSPEGSKFIQDLRREQEKRVNP